MAEQTLDCLHDEVKKHLHAYLNKEVYTAAAVAISDQAHNADSDLYISAGKSGHHDTQRVDERTIFDLASLTKPLVTLPSILHLIERGKISWKEELDSLLERPLNDRYRRIDLHSLLCHCSGLTAHRDYWKEMKSMDKSERNEWLLNELINEPLEYETGTDHLYSDVGYMLLGYVVEIKSGLTLDRYWKNEIGRPAGVEDSLCFAPQKAKKKYNSLVCTGHCPWSKEELTGLVHDDNCRALGGVAGHAGLFGSLTGVLKLCKEYLNLYHNRSSSVPLSSETFKRAAKRIGGSDWSCGFSLPSPSGSSSGSQFSKRSIGHLGFTGVSFWIDVEREVVVSFLTNRVRQGDDMEGIREARPALHDTIMRCLTGKKNPPAEPGDK